MLDALDADDVRRWFRAGAAAIGEQRSAIDALNVFPVADADTGTNLWHTISAAASAVEPDEPRRASGPDESRGASGPDESRLASGPDESRLASGPAESPPGRAGDVLGVAARAAAQAARGNSGVITASILGGLAEASGTVATLDGLGLRRGLRAGADRAAAAVAEPVDGTILTVIRAAADAAPEDPSVAVVARAAAVAAAGALRRTRYQLAVLTAAGVVDAGGRGLLVLLETLADCAGVDLKDLGAPDGGDGSDGLDASDVPVAAVGPPTVARGGGYEVQYLLPARPDEIERLRGRLSVLGDSLAVVDTGQGTWNVHIHVDDPGAALEAGLDIGRPSRISVVSLPEPADPRGTGSGSSTAVVAIARGGGLAEMLRAEGVAVVDGFHPTVSDVLAVVRSLAAEQIVLLPNAARLAEVAEAAAAQARREGRRATVVPTRSPVQGLAAVAVHDPGRRFDDDVVAMAEAAAATRYGEITIAERRSLTSAGVCEQGDVLGLIDGDVVDIGADISAVALTVTDRLLGVGAELLTVLVGLDAPDGIGAAVTEHVRSRAALTEVCVVAAGQPRPPVVIGAE